MECKCHHVFLICYFMSRLSTSLVGEVMKRGFCYFFLELDPIFIWLLISYRWNHALFIKKMKWTYMAENPWDTMQSKIYDPMLRCYARYHYNHRSGYLIFLFHSFYFVIKRIKDDKNLWCKHWKKFCFFFEKTKIISTFF